MPREMIEQEADFFRLVHSLLEEQRRDQKGRSDTRQHRREPYPALQMIAPHVGAGLPEESAFREVRCFDLSTSGFAYLTPTPPPTQSLVVALGAAPRLTYLTAEVAHHTPLTLVGCRFTGRMQ